MKNKMKRMRIISLLTIVLLLNSVFVFSQKAQIEKDPYQLSSHVLDVQKGVGAKNVEVQLFKLYKQEKQDNWVLVTVAKTDDNGRIKTFLPREEGKVNSGIYKLTFLTKDYYNSQNQPSFYPHVDVIFEIKDDTHYHVPITLSPFGYSTYRGN